MGIPVYSARAGARAGRPSSGTAPTRVLILLSLAVFGTALSCVLAIQVVRKRSSSIIAFDGALTGPENDQLLNATGEAPAQLAAKRARRPVYSPVGAIPEPYPSAATPGPHGGAAESPLKPASPPLQHSTEIHPNSAFYRPEIGYDPTRWTTPLHLEASSTAAITLPVLFADFDHFK
ncbi:unnamed protein product, partial [Anisakis simplex]|uniref:Transmembrane protein n=1 Tax=Anisakis simplex TaxID=6269 RepID=A0A0M3JDS4_ANISI